MIHNSLVRVSALAALCFCAATAFASGSDGGAGAETGDAQAYNAGKSVYASKLACSGCPLAGMALDADLAKAVLAGKGVSSLSTEESQSLAVYLKRRFKL